MLVGLVAMASDAPARGTRPIPCAAADAALETFASLARARHPGLSLLPLRRIGTNGPVVPAPTGQIIRPFATPKDRHALLDGNQRIGAPDDHRVD